MINDDRGEMHCCFVLGVILNIHPGDVIIRFVVVVNIEERSLASAHQPARGGNTIELLPTFRQMDRSLVIHKNRPIGLR